MYENGKTQRADVQAGEDHSCSGENGALLYYYALGLKAWWVEFTFAPVLSLMLFYEAVKKIMNIVKHVLVTCC